MADRRIDNNTNPASCSLVPHVTVRGRWVFVDWEDDRNHPGSIHFDVLGRVSPDGGRHWADPAIINRNTPGTAYVGQRHLARAGEAIVYDVWTDDRVSPSTFAMNVYFNRTLDGGRTWGRGGMRSQRSRRAQPPHLWPRSGQPSGDRICIALDADKPLPGCSLRSVPRTMRGDVEPLAGDHVFVTWVDDPSDGLTGHVSESRAVDGCLPQRATSG